jgi:hypothetical protein
MSQRLPSDVCRQSWPIDKISFGLITDCDVSYYWEQLPTFPSGSSACANFVSFLYDGGKDGQKKYEELLKPAGEHAAKLVVFSRRLPSKSDRLLIVIKDFQFPAPESWERQTLPSSVMFFFCPDRFPSHDEATAHEYFQEAQDILRRAQYRERKADLLEMQDFFESHETTLSTPFLELTSKLPRNFLGYPRDCFILNDYGRRRLMINDMVLVACHEDWPGQDCETFVKWIMKMFQLPESEVRENLTVHREQGQSTIVKWTLERARDVQAQTMQTLQQEQRLFRIRLFHPRPTQLSSGCWLQFNNGDLIEFSPAYMPKRDFLKRVFLFSVAYFDGSLAHPNLVAAGITKSGQSLTLNLQFWQLQSRWIELLSGNVLCRTSPPPTEFAPLRIARSRLAPLLEVPGDRLGQSLNFAKEVLRELQFPDDEATNKCPYAEEARNFIWMLVKTNTCLCLCYTSYVLSAAEEVGLDDWIIPLSKSGHITVLVVNPHRRQQAVLFSKAVSGRDVAIVESGFQDNEKTLEILIDRSVSSYEFSAVKAQYVDRRRSPEDIFFVSFDKEFGPHLSVRSSWATLTFLVLFLTTKKSRTHEVSRMLLLEHLGRLFDVPELVEIVSHVVLTSIDILNRVVLDDLNNELCEQIEAVKKNERVVPPTYLLVQLSRQVRGFLQNSLVRLQQPVNEKTLQLFVLQLLSFMVVL